MAKKGKQQKRSQLGNLLALAGGAILGGLVSHFAGEKGVSPEAITAVGVALGGLAATNTTGKLRYAALGAGALAAGSGAVYYYRKREADKAKAKQLAAGGRTTTGESRNGETRNQETDELAEERLAQAKANNKPWTVIRQRAA